MLGHGNGVDWKYFILDPVNHYKITIKVGPLPCIPSANSHSPKFVQNE